MIETAVASDRVQFVRLSLVSGVGPLLRKALLDRFGTPDAIFSAGADELCQVEGIGPNLARRLAAANVEIDAEAEVTLAEQNGISLLLQSDGDYPRLLRAIHDPPAVLYCRGVILPQDKQAIAIVGTRRASRYGIAQAKRFADGLARAGFTIVSGLARGVDAAAHQAALAAGGRTIAVLAGGLMTIYPPEHKALANDVAAGGCLMTEAPPQMVPLGGCFPQRNRIISGISLGTIVVEAADRSGALITARHANEQGREVFAVPGPIDHPNSRGTHGLIRDGAKLIQSVDDVLEELDPLAAASGVEKPIRQQLAEAALNDVEQQVLAAIDSSPTLLDEVAIAAGLPIPRVLATVSVLEMRRLVRRTSGTHVVRV